MTFDSVLGELIDTHWRSATEWTGSAKDNVLEYYRRLIPYWPIERRFLVPADRVVERSVLGKLSPTDLDRVRAGVQQIADHVTPTEMRLESTTRTLLGFVLAWALAVERGELLPEADPGAPLRDLFRSGFQIEYTDAGIEVWFRKGKMTFSPPPRSSFVT